MKAFGNFRINTKPNFQSEEQAGQEDEGQIVSPTFQCSFFEMVLLFFFWYANFCPSFVPRRHFDA